MEMIITAYNPPPIPCRDYDWSAHFTDPTDLPGEVTPNVDDNGESERAFGTTELDAIHNLLESHND